MKRTAAVITVSDRCSRGEREDTAGPAVVRLLEENGYEIAYRACVPDDGERIREELIGCADELGAAFVLTVGGTGFSPRDVTPEATMSVVERPVPGLPEAMRAAGMRVTERACLSRAAAGIRGRTLILNLPGSERAAVENLSAVIGSVAHGLDVLRGNGSTDCGEGER